MRVQDKDFYSSEVHYFEDENRAEISEHAVTVMEFLKPVLPYLDGRAHGNAPLRVVELGAGTCLASLMLRKRFPNAEITCLDISIERMEKLAPYAARMVGVSSEGINYVEADFTERLPLPSGKFDVVLFDAALHHSRNIWTTLAECHRILVPDGAVVALREQYLALLTYSYALRRLRKTREFQAGVAENSYLREQYEYYFMANGFDPIFHAVSPGRWRYLALLNGILFSKWSAWAKKMPVVGLPDLEPKSPS